MCREARNIGTIVMTCSVCIFVIFFIICCKFTFATSIPKQRPILRFNKNGEFKIIQVFRIRSLLSLDNGSSL